MSDDKIKGLGPKRDPRALLVQRDIVIPAGTILRHAANGRGGTGAVEAPFGCGKDYTVWLVADLHPDAEASGYFKEVSA